MKRLFVVFAVLACCAMGHAAELTIGLIPEQNVFKQMERYKPLGDYLAEKTGAKIKFTILQRYGNVIDHFKTEKMDGAFFGSFTGALALEKLGVEAIVRPVNLDGSSTYCGYVFVRKDSGIRSVADMKGKRIAFVERATTAGYVYPAAWFRENGVSDVFKYFREAYFGGSHDAAINAVMTRKADVGCAKHSMFDRLARKDPKIKDQLAILARSPDVPSNGLLVRADLDPRLKKRLQEVLLGMDKDTEGAKRLKAFEALRFVPLSRDDYAPVFRIAREAGIELKNYVYVNK